MVPEQRNFETLLKKQWSKGNFTALGLSADINMIRPYIQADHKQRELLLQKAELKKDKEKQRAIITIRDSMSDFEAIMVFNRKIIEATWKYVCAFVIDLASFDECEQNDKAIRQVVDYCRDLAPDVPVIIDGKKTGSATEMDSHVATLIRRGGDAMTVSPAMGEDALLPLLKHENLGAFILCQTSIPGADVFQDRLSFIQTNELTEMLKGRKVRQLAELASECNWYNTENDYFCHFGWSAGYFMPAYHYLALTIHRWYQLVTDPVSNIDFSRNNCAAIVGTTSPYQLKIARQLLGDEIPIFLPSFHSKGEEFNEVIMNSVNNQAAGILIHVSNDIIFAAQPGEDYARAAHDAAKQLHNDIQQAIAKAYAPN